MIFQTTWSKKRYLRLIALKKNRFEYTFKYHMILQHIESKCNRVNILAKKQEGKSWYNITKRVRIKHLDA